MNAKKEFIENLAHIISRELELDLKNTWNEIDIYFENIDFTKYDKNVKNLNIEDQVYEVLTNFDTCVAVLSNMDIEDVKGLFATLENYLNYGEYSQDETNSTPWELGYNRAILDFKLLDNV